MELNHRCVCMSLAAHHPVGGAGRRGEVLLASTAIRMLKREEYLWKDWNESLAYRPPCQLLDISIYRAMYSYIVVAICSIVLAYQEGEGGGASQEEEEE